MANYGRQTQGAAWIDTEIDLTGRTITLPGGESITSSQVYLRTTNGSTANVKCALYNTSNGLVYESNQLSFTDDTGGWKAVTWPATTPTAGTYRHVVGAAPISGGLNTVEIANDVISADTGLRRASGSLAGAQSTYPAFPATVVWDNDTQDVNDVSIYLITSASASGIPRFMNVFSRRRRAA